MMRDHIDRRAAETAARQARAQASWMFARQLHQQIQFFSAVLQIISRTFVALLHVLSELAMIIGAQGPFTSYHPLNFTDHMPRAFILALFEFIFVRLNGF